MRMKGLSRLVLAALAIALFAVCSCKAKENTIRADSVELVTKVKQTKELGELIKLASPAYQQAAVRAGEELSLSADALLSNSKFPIDLKNAVAAPEPGELTVSSRGRFAEVTFSDDAGKVFTLKLVQDRGKWYFHMETPAEKKRYGEFRVK